MTGPIQHYPTTAAEHNNFTTYRKLKFYTSIVMKLCYLNLPLFLISKINIFIYHISKVYEHFADPGHFGPKTVQHYMSSVPKCLTFYCRCRSVFGTLRHQCRTVSTFYEGAEVSNRHFGTSAELSRTDRRRVFVLVSLHHLMSHLHHPS